MLVTPVPSYNAPQIQQILTYRSQSDEASLPADSDAGPLSYHQIMVNA